MKSCLTIFIFLFASVCSSKITSDNMQALYNRAMDIRRTKPDSSKIFFYDLLDYSFKKSNHKLYRIASEQLAYIYYFNYNLDSSLKYHKRALKYYKLDSNLDKMASISNLIGNSYRKKSEYIRAIKYYKLSEEYHSEANNFKGLSYVYNNFGLTYLKILSYEKAVDYFKKSLELKEQKKDSAGIAKTLGNIGLALVEFGSKQSALDYYNKSYDVLSKLRDTNNLPILLNQIASAYLELDILDTAILKFRSSLQYSQMLGANTITARSYLGLSKTYIKQNDLFSAEKYAIEANKLLENSKTIYDLASSYIMLARIYAIQNESKKFNDYFTKAKTLIRTNEFDKLKLELNEFAYEYYNRKKDYKKALDAFKEYSEQKATILDNQFKLTQAKLELDMKERINIERLENVKNQKNIIEDKFITQKKFMYVLFVCFLIILIILVYVIKLFLDKKKISTELKNTINAKDKFFSIIAHDLKGPISAFKVLTSQMYDYYNDFSEEEQKEFTHELSKQSEDIYKLLENLLTWSRIETKNLIFHPDTFKLKFLLSNVLPRFDRKLKEKNISIISDVNEDVELYFDVLGLDIVIFNIVSNAINFSPAGNYVHISVNRSIKYYEIKIKDEGVGISKGILENIKNPIKRINKLGTAGERGTGLGIIVSKAIVEQNDGELNFQSEKNNGTKVTIKIPHS